MSMTFATSSHSDALDSNSYYRLQFPTKESRISDCLRYFNLPDISTDKNCVVADMELFNQPFPLLNGQSCNLDELNYLAKRLDSIDPKERQSFLAVAEATNANTAEALINLTFNTHCYSVANNFNDFHELGKRLYLNEHFTIPPNKKPDFNQYAVKILEQKPLAATLNGLVFKNSNQPEQIYNGRQFPQYQYSGDVAGTLTIHSEAGTEYLDLPCERIALDKALVRLGEERLEPCEYSFENDTLPKTACILFENSDDPTGSFTALNDLANGMSKQNKQEYANFLALCAWAKPTCIAEHITLCEQLYDFQIVLGATNLQEYGKKLVLESWKQPNADILPYIDFEGYARNKMWQSPGHFTDYGLLKYVGNSMDVACLADLPFQPPNYTTLRLFSPINCDLYERAEYGGLAEYPEQLSASESATFEDSICDTIVAYCQDDDPRGLAPYLDSGSLADKVYSMIPTVEEYGGRLFGVLECQLREPLTEQEYEQLCENWSGQASDGWGEGFEQQEIKVNDGQLNVHFWSSDKDWSIMSESQLKGEPEQGFSMQMQ